MRKSAVQIRFEILEFMFFNEKPQLRTGVQAVTLKMAGRYFWMWGHLFVVRMAGSLQLESGKIGLLMGAAITV